MNQTGVAFLPGTFPTGTVLSAMHEGLPASKDEWTRRKVNDLYYLYETGVKEHGYPIVRPQQFEVKEYMMENSAYPEHEIRVFLYVLMTLAQKGEIQNKWWNIPLQKEQGFLPAVGDMAKDLDKWAGTIKWGSIALVFGGVLYLTWPYLRALRARSKSHG